MKRKKQKPATWYKKKIDAAVSALIHERDEGKSCIDGCGRKGEQSGHFRRRELMSTRWHPQNQNLQSAYCNCWLNGREYEYGIGLDKKWGEGTAKKLLALSRKVKQWDRKELEYLLEATKEGYEEYEQMYFALCITQSPILENLAK